MCYDANENFDGTPVVNGIQCGIVCMTGENAGKYDEVLWMNSRCQCCVYGIVTTESP